MRRKLWFLALAVSMCGLMCAAQQAGSAGAQAPANNASPAAKGSNAPASLINLPPMSGREIREALRSEEFTPRTAQAVLQELGDAMQAHDFEGTGGMFDPDSYPQSFFDEMAAAFNYFNAFEVYYHLETTEVNGGTAQLSADFQMEGTPAQEGAAPQRRMTTLTLELQRVKTRGGQEWRIVRMEPPDFLFRF